MAERELYGNNMEPEFPFDLIRGTNPESELVNVRGTLVATGVPEGSHSRSWRRPRTATEHGPRFCAG